LPRYFLERVGTDTEIEVSTARYFGDVLSRYPGKIEAVSGGDQMTTYYRAVMAQLAVLLLVIGAAPLFAQSTATIVGVVRDSGGVLPGATVTVRNVDTGLTRSVPTGEEGAYRFPALPVGPYEIRAELAGFRTAVRSGVRLLVGQ